MIWLKKQNENQQYTKQHRERKTVQHEPHQNLGGTVGAKEG